MIARLFLLLLLFPAISFADALSDVRSALTRLGGREPIRATYDVRLSRNSKGRFTNAQFTGHVAVELEGDANGIRIVVPRAVLDQITREQRAQLADPKQPAPTVGAMEEVEPVAAAETLDHAPALLQTIDGAKVIEDRAGAWQGRPARIVVLRLSDRTPSNHGEVRLGKSTVTENKMTLWLGPDHVPLAAEHQRAIKLSFLIIKGEIKQRRNWQFARHGDRLVRVRYETNGSGSGMGQSGTESSTIVARVHP